MQLKVIKADGSVEEYLHTKIISTLMKVVCVKSDADSFAAEQLADAVTFYLYNDYDRGEICSSQILSVITAVLDSSGYHNSAEALIQSHHYRNLLRSRISVVEAGLQTVDQAKAFIEYQRNGICCLWNKSIISDWLVTKHNLSHTDARVVASMVEEQILKSDLRSVPKSFIKHLALTKAAVICQAKKTLEPKTREKPHRAKTFKSKIQTHTDNTSQQKEIYTASV